MYRIWIPDKKKIDITRDVEFIEKPKNILKEENEKSKRKLIEFSITNLENNIENNEENRENWFDAIENNNIDENINEANVDGLENNNEPNDIEEDIPEDVFRRGRERPKKIMTGQRGRPKKIYQMVNNINQINQIEEFGGLAEISLHQAINGPNLNEWLDALAIEMNAIIKNDTWIFVDCPENIPIISSRIILKNKYNADGTEERRKARLVARKFTQRLGIDFDETYAPVARISSIRLVMAMATNIRTRRMATKKTIFYFYYFVNLILSVILSLRIVSFN